MLWSEVEGLFGKRIASVMKSAPCLQGCTVRVLTDKFNKQVIGKDGKPVFDFYWYDIYYAYKYATGVMLDMVPLLPKSKRVGVVYD